MMTTIQISGTTKQLLEILKQKEHAKTYDHVIQNLLRKQQQLPTSLFGSMKGMKWKKEDRLELNEL